MDALKEAQHQAGKQTALWKVFVPFMLISGLLMLAALLCASSDFATQFASPLIYLAGAAQLLAIFGGVTTYFIARKRPKLVRKQLEIAKAEEEAAVRSFETTLAKHRELVTQRETTAKQAIQAAYEMTIAEQREAFLKPHKARLETLREQERQASKRDRMLNQDFYLRLAHVIREAEAALIHLESETAPEIPQEVLAVATSNANSEMKRLWLKVEQEIAAYEEMLTQAKQNIASIELLLKS